MKKKILALIAALSIASSMGQVNAADTYEQQYLANGDFDSGLSHWGQTWQSGKGTMTVVKYEGDNVVHMKTDNGRCYISQDIQNITEGDRLTLSFRQKVDNCLVEGARDDGGAFHGNAVVGSNVPNFYSSGKFYEGYPVAASADSVVTSTIATDTFATAERTNLKFYQKHDTHTRVYKIKVNGNSSEYEKITLDAIAPSVNGSSKAVIYTSWVQLMAVIVYEQ